MYFLKNILVLFILSSISGFAYASQKGLPQLDLETYPSLIFWSIISLLIGYILMAFIVTPSIQSIINLRETNIQNDLIKAKTSNEEAEIIKNTLSNKQEEIKLNSQNLINKAISEAKNLLDNSEKKISDKMNVKIIEAEQQIHKLKNEVISELLNNVEDITRDIIQKFTTIKPLSKDIKQTVKTVSKNILMEKQ
ncbi:MAG: preprotein translocase subunit TatA [Proteobacteria bacterium]|jgi:F-type H+-transporting ATPase subunit b|nr:preprotein translocase subunit TatA [Pseudomonadota bacterium]MDA1135898.1 preprotein translocase subunit TatA [Pseudomonadota bacterium]|tara:strand:+ start:117 stop:698 length:582 start_codon:yes stop_codon:yes gene_type:complete